jgi:tetratricopeptide (TPR) repeat protein
MGFFKRQRKDKQDIVGGYIGYYGLAEWWLSTFSKEERDYIIKTFKPMGSSGEVLIRGNIGYIDQSPSRLLCDIAGWFKQLEDRSIVFRFIKKAEELLDENSNILDLHFFYQAKINIYYKYREIEPEALAMAIEACKQQIALAPKAKKAFLDEHKDSSLPSHVGFTQLAIIEEKQKNYEEAIRLSEEALKQGWHGDWEKRIERCMKKNYR